MVLPSSDDPLYMSLPPGYQNNGKTLNPLDPCPLPPEYESIISNVKHP